MDVQVRTAVLQSFSLDHPGFAADPYRYYEALRTDCPVFFDAAADSYLISRYQDVKTILNEYSVYDSREGSLQSREIREGTLDFEPIIAQAPPDHTRVRRLAAKAYSIQAAGRLEQLIQETAAAILGEVSHGADEIDLIRDYAHPLAIQSILRLLEIPAVQLQQAGRLMDNILLKRVDSGSQGDGQAAAELAAYMAGHFHYVRNHGVGGFPGDIVNSEVDGETFSNGEAFGMLLFAMVAGTEDLVRGLANVAYMLWAHPDQKALLLADVPGRIAPAIAEALRLLPTTHYLRRVAMQPVILQGTRLAKGSRVVALLGAANRDESVFEDADRYLILRKNVSAALTFGSGPHVCIGKNLAKVILRVAVLELLDKWPRYELEMSRARRIHQTPIIGFQTLPCRVCA